MGKVAGSYESVVRGVSQQVPQDRRSGQMEQQLNMLPDPVIGLARRHGSMMQDEVKLSGSFEAILADTVHHNVTTFFVGGVEYDLIYRTTASALGTPSFAFAFNKVTGKFIPIVYATGDTVLNTLVSGGVSAVVGVGKYLFIAGNTIVPTYTATDAWGAASNQSQAAAWVRGGAYSRTFKLTVTLTTGTVTASYKTDSASYPGTLDTSDIPIYEIDGVTLDPEYQKKVNDRVNEYNGNVTAWIGTAAEDITPENIAQKLVDSLVAQGVTATRVAGTVCITDSHLVDLAADDGGDGSLLRAVGNTVTAADLVSTVHKAGKIVKVRPSHSNGDNAFYLVATPKTPGATGFTDVTWNEGAGYVMQPNNVFVLGTVQDDTLYLASSATKLATLTGGSHPPFLANAVGDAITSALPTFFGKRIDYLGVMQDRLIIGSGAVLLFSRPGDYFNWFRMSVLTVADSDPWEVFALGAEDDTITCSTTYERNLVLHGNRFWYEVSGRAKIDPKTSIIVPGAAYEDANDAPPVVSGNFTMYAKYGGIAGKEKTSLHQVQAGLVQDTPDSIEISQQLDDYISGKPVQIAAIAAPNYVFLRTDTYRNGLYVYGYLDNLASNQRVLDNWHKWAWSEQVGFTVGLSKSRQDLLVYLVKENAEGAWIAAESFTLHAGISDYPYADSLRLLSATTSGYIKAEDPAFFQAITAFDNGKTYRFIGALFPDAHTLQELYPGDADGLWVGLPFDAYVVPTNPYINDRNDRAIVAGRLTLGRVTVTVQNTGGFYVDVTTLAGTWRSVDFSGRILGAPTAQVGRQPIVTASLNATIGKEIRECSYKISAKHWLPLTVTSIEWQGQFFNNVRRV